MSTESAIIADWLARFAYSRSCGVHQLDQPPRGAKEILLLDYCGRETPRLEALCTNFSDLFSRMGDAKLSHSIES